MTIWDVCPSERDRRVADLLWAQADKLAAFSPAARNPAPDTPAPAEVAPARAELTRLAGLRRRLNDLFDGGPRSSAPWGDDEIGAAALDWLRALDPNDSGPLVEAAELLSDPLRELEQGAGQIDAAGVAALIEAAGADPSADVGTIVSTVGIDVFEGLMRVGETVLGRGSIAPDAGVEVLVPLRIETRFDPPNDDRPNWLLRLRVYPDEVSIARPSARPTKDELDRLDEALGAAHRVPPVDDAAAFDRLAAAVGAPRAAWLLRTITVHHPDPSLPPFADRTLVAGPRAGFPQPQQPAGLPPAIDVWIVPRGGTPERADTLSLDREAIAADLDLKLFEDVAAIPGGELPVTWWTSFRRAVDVGLGAEIELGPDRPDLEAILVSGLGDQTPDELFCGHAEAGRLAILPPGTATNTVEGERTTELGRDPDAWRPLAARTGLDEVATTDAMRALTGRDDPVAPMLGGHTDMRGFTASLLEALWPVLFGRAIRDVAGAENGEEAIAEWAGRYLCPEGPYGAVRVGGQPYGLLPVTSLGGWVAHETDPIGEDRLRAWVSSWRDEAAAFAEAHGTVVGADSERLLELLGEHAPSARWSARPVAPLRVARALQVAHGLFPLAEPTGWDKATAESLAGSTSRFDPIAPVGPALPLPREWEEPIDLLMEMIDMEPEQLLAMGDELGLLGHLLRGSLLVARALLGRSFQELANGQPIDPGRPLSIWEPDNIRELGFMSTEGNLEQLEAQGGEPGFLVVARFRALQRAARETVERFAGEPDRASAALFALLDTAAFRVDPWVTGIADRRLRALARTSPFRLGAYGWVDAPGPHEGVDGRLAPGPTAAGMLHAPSPTQALAAALLRDAAVRHPGDERWQLTIDSARVRAADRLADRVRLGIHPYEALGLEVERLIGDWETVRALRREFPLRGDGGERRCCDGRRVLGALLRGEEPVPAGLPPDIAARVEPLDHVLNTYGDLLVADGVHALVSGRADLAGAAMEAAAGLGAPPELRAIRTPRASAGVTVSVLATLPLGDTPPRDAGPAVAADPAFARLLDAELGEPDRWSWTVEGAATVTLADLGLHGAELLDTPALELEALLRGPADGAAVSSTGGGERLDRARGLAVLLGGGEEDPPLAGAISGSGRLDDRLADLVARATALESALTALDPSDALAALARWRIDPVAEDPEGGPPARVEAGRAELKQRITAAGAVAPELEALRVAIRVLSGHRSVPVLPLGPLKDEFVSTPQLDRDWLEIVAAVRPRLAALEAHQLTGNGHRWPAAVASPNASADPWTARDQVRVAYGPGLVSEAGEPVAIAALDRWVDSIPGREHATSAAFGFNGPKARAPQAVLLAVPPDLGHRMSGDELRDAVLETRSLVRARAARPDGQWQRLATPAPLLAEPGDYEPLLRRWSS